MAIEYTSCAAAQIEEFVRHRKAAGTICEGAQRSLHLFDVHVASAYPGATGLTQEMVDTWCARRPTESANTCGARCRPIKALVRFLVERGEDGLREPDLPRPQESGYVPHAFTDEELVALFAEADAWEPARKVAGQEMYVRTKRTLPVIFRLLWSSGIRTCEARLLRRECVDLGLGTMLIREGKGLSERMVALNESMLAMVRDYDAAMEELWPGRAYFFPNGPEGFIPAVTLNQWFRMLWSRVSDVHATPYMLRHDFCVRCINQMVGRGTDGLSDLEWVSKAMGHTSVDVTVRCYYHLVPALSAKVQERSDGELELTIPEARR